MKLYLLLKKIFRVLKSVWPHIFYITGVLFTTSRLFEIKEIARLDLLAYFFILIFMTLLFFARYYQCSLVIKYILAFLAFMIYMTMIRYYNVHFQLFNKSSFILILIYASLFPDIITPNLIGIILAIQYYAYIGQKPKDQVLGTMAGLLITSTSYSIIFFLLKNMTHERDKYKKLSLQDSLTGLYTLEYIMEKGKEFLNNKQKVAVMVTDLNHFKQINDTYGHLLGNEILIKFAGLLKEEMAKFHYQSYVGRLGGDEFVILVNDCSATEATILSSQLYDHMKTKLFRIDPDIEPMYLPFAIGLSCSNSITPLKIEKLLYNADINMYLNKYDLRETNINTDLTKIITSEHGQQLLNVLAEKDMYTYVHSKYTAQYALAIAKGLNLSIQFIESLYIAGWFHDMGKLIISNDILRKTGKLTDKEYLIIKEHVQYGLSIISTLGFSESIINGIKYHHEHWDGHGYPNQLKGRDIPLEGRILKIADAFSAMNIKRVYRSPIPQQDAVQEMRLKTGIEFDPELMEILIHLVGTKDINIINSNEIKKMFLNTDNNVNFIPTDIELINNME